MRGSSRKDVVLFLFHQLGSKVDRRDDVVNRQAVFACDFIARHPFRELA